MAFRAFRICRKTTYKSQAPQEYYDKRRLQALWPFSEMLSKYFTCITF